MEKTTPSVEPAQVALPTVTGHDAAGQWELHEPGPRLEGDRELEREVVDPRQCLLPGVPGVRQGAWWQRDNATTRRMPWPQLELALEGQAQHRGRWWTQRDHEIRRALELQTWGVVEVADRPAILPTWMRRRVLDAPDGRELVLPRLAGQRALLAIVWDAFRAGTGGVLLTRDEWAEVLGVSPRTIHNHRKALRELGLISERETWRPAARGGEQQQGSWESQVLIRIGPELERVALAAFEHKSVKAPRGTVRRRDARAWATALRESGRARGREQHAERRAARSVARASVLSPGSWGAAPAGTAGPPSLTPQNDVPTAAQCCSGWQKVPTSPPPPCGVRLGGPAVPAGAAPQDPGERTDARTSLRDGASADLAELEQVGRLQPLPRPARGPQPPGRARLEGRRGPRRPDLVGARAPRGGGAFAAAVAELARTLEHSGDSPAAAAVRDALVHTAGMPVKPNKFTLRLQSSREPHPHFAFAAEFEDGTILLQNDRDQPPAVVDSWDEARERFDVRKGDAVRGSRVVMAPEVIERLRSETAQHYPSGWQEPAEKPGSAAAPPPQQARAAAGGVTKPRPEGGTLSPQQVADGLRARAEELNQREAELDAREAALVARELELEAKLETIRLEPAVFDSEGQ